MKIGTLVTVNDPQYDGKIGRVTYHDPAVWTEVTWENGVISAFEMEEINVVGGEVEVKIPTVEQPLSNGFDPVFVAKVIAKIDEYHKTYLVEHPTDWDCCGFASIAVEFGRKRKMKDQILALGFNVGYKSGTESILNPTFRIPYCGHQSLSYKEDIARVVCGVINEVVGEKVAYMTSYMD